MLAGGTVPVVVTDNGGVTRTATWVIPAATMAINPTSGPKGAALAVSGSNFVPLSVVTITMAGSYLATTTANQDGQFYYETIVPSWVNIGPNTVTAQDALNMAVATFTVPSGVVTLSPSEGVPGQTITFSGSGFPAYSGIDYVHFIRTVGGTADVTPLPKPVVQGDGTVTGTFVVPASAAGLATVTISAGGTSGAATFTVTSTAATPAVAFASLIANNQLTRVWSFDNASKAWHMYDPADLANSDITTLTAGTSYWIGVTADVTLTYGTNSWPLTTGWNNIGWLN